MFTVSVDLQRSRVLVTLSGFASQDDVQQFESDFAIALRRLPARAVGHQLLYDVSQAQVQSQEVVIALRRLVRATPATSRFALINACALAGRQLSRIFAGIEPRIFDNAADALAWLDE